MLYGFELQCLPPSTKQVLPPSLYHWGKSLKNHWWHRRAHLCLLLWRVLLGQAAFHVPFVGFSDKFHLKILLNKLSGLAVFKRKKNWKAATFLMLLLSSPFLYFLQHHQVIWRVKKRRAVHSMLAYPLSKLAEVCISSSYVKYSLQSYRNWRILLSYVHEELLWWVTIGICWVPGKK